MFIKKQVNANKSLFCIILSLVIVFLTSINPAFACRCREPGPPEAIFKNSEIVFEGVATKVELSEINKSADKQTYQGATVSTSFDVVKSYKGNVAGSVKVNSRLGSSLCGWQPGRLGQNILVIAQRTDASTLTTNSCLMWGADDNLRQYLKQKSNTHR